MPVRRRGQMLVAMVLMLGLLVMSLLVTTYQAHAVFLRTRSIIARETAAAITADFNRALAAVLAAYTRICFNQTRFPDAASNFPELTHCEVTLAERAAENFLNMWADTIRIVYAEYGVQIRWRRGVAEVLHLLPHQPYFLGTLNYSWYKPISGSYAFAILSLNLTSAGFYNWREHALVGLTVHIIKIQQDKNVTIRVLVDDNIPYGLLLVRGWMEVYTFDEVSKRWRRVDIKEVNYMGYGHYIAILQTDLPKDARVRIVVSDERGIIVVAEGRVS